TAVAATWASPARIATSAFLTNVRAADRYGRFRCRRRSATRIRFSADLLFANVPHLVRVSNYTTGTPKERPRAATCGCYQTGALATTCKAHRGVVQSFAAGGSPSSAKNPAPHPAHRSAIQ